MGRALHSEEDDNLHADNITFPPSVLHVEYHSKSVSGVGVHMQHRWSCKLEKETGADVITMTSPWRASIHRIEVDMKHIFLNISRSDAGKGEELMADLHRATILP